LIGLLIYGVSTPSASRTLDQEVALKRYPRGPAAPPAPPPPPGAAAAPRAPDAAQALPLLRGPAHASLASFRGRVLVLNFWASWCEPCQVEAPLLERAHRQLERHGGTVLGVTYLDAPP